MASNNYDHIYFEQVGRAVPLFNKYRRCGHKFDAGVYNSIIHSLAEKVHETRMGPGFVIKSMNMITCAQQVQSSFHYTKYSMLTSLPC